MTSTVSSTGGNDGFFSTVAMQLGRGLGSGFANAFNPEPNWTNQQRAQQAGGYYYTPTYNPTMAAPSIFTADFWLGADPMLRPGNVIPRSGTSRWTNPDGVVSSFVPGTAIPMTTALIGAVVVLGAIAIWK